MRLVYLDNAATTQVCRAAADKALEMMTVNYGNPPCRMGRHEQAMETARKQVSKLLGCSPETLFFTSGGTESNNLAVFGAALAKQRAGRHIVTTAVEHSSVLESVNELERQGCEVTRLVPDKNGVIEPEHVAEACRSDTVLVSIMYVNNEIGIHFPIDRIVSSVRRSRPVL